MNLSQIRLSHCTLNARNLVWCDRNVYLGCTHDEIKPIFYNNLLVMEKNYLMEEITFSFDVGIEIKDSRKIEYKDLEHSEPITQ